MDNVIDRLTTRWRQLHGLLFGYPPRASEPMPLDRAALFQQLAALRARRAVEVDQSRRRVDELTLQWRDAQTIADDLQQQISAIEGAAFCASLDGSVQENRLLAQLAERSSMSLELFIQELDSEREVLNHKEPCAIPGVRRDYLALKTLRTLDTDGPSIQRRVRALHAARQRAEAMKLEPLTIAEMNREILRLKKSLPPIETEEIVGHWAAVLAG